MSFVMIKPSQLSAFAFVFDRSSVPAGSSAVADLTQQDIQNAPNLWNRQCGCVFFSPAGFPELKTIAP